jgi:hypothetical protein
VIDNTGIKAISFFEDNIKTDLGQVCEHVYSIGLRHNLVIQCDFVTRAMNLRLQQRQGIS